MNKLISMLWATPLIAKLLFKIEKLNDGAVQYLDKDNKKTRYLMGEDAFCTTKFTLTVADGASSSKFISQYFV